MFFNLTKNLPGKDKVTVTYYHADTRVRAQMIMHRNVVRVLATMLAGSTLSFCLNTHENIHRKSCCFNLHTVFVHGYVQLVHSPSIPFTRDTEDLLLLATGVFVVPVHVQ